MRLGTSRGLSIPSFASHTKAFSRVSKTGNSRREKLLRFSENTRGKFSAPVHADFFTKGLSKTAVSFITRMASWSKDAPLKSESIKTEPQGRVVTTSGTARKIFPTSAAEQFDRSSRRICLP